MDDGPGYVIDFAKASERPGYVVDFAKAGE